MTKAELLELLKKARKQLKKYHVPKDEQTITLSIDMLENALLEQPQVVRCKDCKWRGTSACFCKSPSDVKDDWYCSEGVSVRK